MKSWKEHLLRSGVPLEYEVGQLLASVGMSVEADFSYVRSDPALGPKEWSVDLEFFEYNSYRNKIKYRFAGLIECKHRSPDKSLVLIPDPNIEYPGYSLGGTTNVIDFHVPYHLDGEAFLSVEQEMPFAYKGIEVFDGGASDDDFRHGIQQLRFATPNHLQRLIDFEMTTDLADAVPVFVTKILVTNAQLRLLRQGTNVSAIQAASSIDDVSDKIERAVFFSDYGPDYEQHFRSVFEPVSADWQRFARTLNDRLGGTRKEMDSLTEPMRMIQALTKAERFWCSRLSSQFFVCTLSGLEPLLKDLREACSRSYKARTTTDRIRRWIRSREKSAK